MVVKKEKDYEEFLKQQRFVVDSPSGEVVYEVSPFLQKKTQKSIEPENQEDYNQNSANMGFIDHSEQEHRQMIQESETEERPIFNNAPMMLRVSNIPLWATTAEVVHRLERELGPVRFQREEIYHCLSRHARSRERALYRLQVRVEKKKRLFGLLWSENMAKFGIIPYKTHWLYLFGIPVSFQAFDLPFISSAPNSAREPMGSSGAEPHLLERDQEILSLNNVLVGRNSEEALLSVILSSERLEHSPRNLSLR